MNQKSLFIAALAVLLLAFGGGAMFYSMQQEQAANDLAAANRAALLRMHSPTLGPANAPVVIVEFLDPACETCAAFYPLVKQMMAANPERIRLVLRYAPFHNGSDKVVAVLEAARRQGKFWPTLEALLATQADWSPHHTPQVARVWKHLEGLGLDLERMAFDITAPDIAQVIAQDLADAQTLGVSKTPEFFVNGKPLPRFGYEPLKQLVDAALAAAPK
ncbi:MAG TPA: thioredoxin domain-containing protein [Rhodocyclaceae bacterium]